MKKFWKNYVLRALNWSWRSIKTSYQSVTSHEFGVLPFLLLVAIIAIYYLVKGIHWMWLALSFWNIAGNSDIVGSNFVFRFYL